MRWQRGMRAPRRNSPPHGLTNKSEETVSVGKEWLTIRKRLAVAGQNAFHHRLLREMHQDSLSERLGAHQRGLGIIERGLDRVRYRARAIGRKQPVGMGAEDFRDAADIADHHRNSPPAPLYHDTRHPLAPA